MQEDILKKKQEAFQQKLEQFLEQQNPELLQEWEEIRELQNLPRRIEEIKQKIETCLATIRNSGLAPLWKAFEDIQRFPQDEELLHQAKAIEQFIKDVDTRIKDLKEELEGEDRSTVAYWKKHGVQVYELRNEEMKKT
jgi:sugar-specific transcriptional regulator TrmB